MNESANRYTHGHHESVLRSHRWRTAENSAAYLLPSLRSGLDLLDIGCGPGNITLDLATRVAPGRTIGIDAAPEAIDAARTEARDRNVTDIDFEVADVYALPYDDGSFDVVHAHQVLQHLADPVAALREMRRVCRAGGVVAARDSDYAAMTWFPESPALERWLDLYRTLARANRAEPDAGRRLLHWAQAAGFTDVESSASTWCYAAPDERAWWGGLWADRVTQSAFAEQSVERGLATRAELDELARSWRAWAAHSDAWFAVLHGEVLCICGSGSHASPS
ncbi:MAG TPA: methyltransferase domain-containing protein [Acidimicrobiia bacterium]|nr:methyltransferase domain-containing protein [Acidimicrobiia bacterium]